MPHRNRDTALNRWADTVQHTVYIGRRRNDLDSRLIEGGFAIDVFPRFDSVIRFQQVGLVVCTFLLWEKKGSYVGEETERAVEITLKASMNYLLHGILGHARHLASIEAAVMARALRMT